jgi:hypothetical protein
VRTPVRIAVPVAIALPLALIAASPTLAAGKGHLHTADTTAPNVAISSPTSGSTTASSLTVVGTSSDNVGVAAVTLQLDTGGWVSASGTTSWSVPLAGLSAGAHSVTARATDAAGNARVTTNSFTVSSPSASPSPSPTSSPSPSPSPSPTATPSPSPSATATPSPSSAPSSGSAPDTQGTWTSPEGTVISVSTTGSWTIAQVYRLLLDASSGPGDFARVAPHLQVNVQDTYASQTSTGASGAPGNYTSYVAAIYLKGNSGNFVTTPEATITHEYGHAWNLMHLYLDHGGDWSGFLNKRWSSSDGSVVLSQDSRLNSGYSWDPNEIMADDYRMLFGNAAAVSEWPNHLNTSIVDPRQQPGLKDWFLSTWR